METVSDLAGSKLSQQRNRRFPLQYAELVKGESAVYKEKGLGGHVRVAASSHCALLPSSTSAQKKTGFHSALEQ